MPLPNGQPHPMSFIGVMNMDAQEFLFMCCVLLIGGAIIIGTRIFFQRTLDNGMYLGEISARTQECQEQLRRMNENSEAIIQLRNELQAHIVHTGRTDNAPYTKHAEASVFQADSGQHSEDSGSIHLASEGSNRYQSTARPAMSDQPPSYEEIPQRHNIAQ